jgi:hypothetical protein
MNLTSVVDSPECLAWGGGTTARHGGSKARIVARAITHHDRVCFSCAFVEK